MVFIDVGDLFCFDLLQSPTVDDSVRNVVRISEPDRVVLVFQELTVHPDDFNVVEFWDEVANFDALKLAVLLFIVLNELNIFSVGPEIVHYLALRVLPVYLGIELDEEWNTKAWLGFETGLNTRDVFVSLVLRRKFGLESIVGIDLGKHFLLLADNDEVFVEFASTLTRICLRSFAILTYSCLQGSAEPLWVWIGSSLLIETFVRHASIFHLSW